MQAQTDIMIPDELIEVLNTHPDLLAVWERMGIAHHREYAGWISGTKIEATRLRRIDKALIMIDQWGREHSERAAQGVAQ